MKSLVKAIHWLISGFWQGLSVCRVIVGNLIFLALIILFLSIFFYDGKKDFPDEADQALCTLFHLNECSPLQADKVLANPRQTVPSPAR